MKEAIVVLLLAVGIASGAVSPHWQNPVEVEEQGYTDREMIVYPAIENTTETINVTARGEIAEHLTFEPQNQTIYSDKKATVDIYISARDLEAGSNVSGNIIITHRPAENSSGSEVATEDSLFMELQITKNEGILGALSAFGLDIGLLTYSIVTVLIGGALVAGYRRYNGGEVDFR